MPEDMARQPRHVKRIYHYVILLPVYTRPRFLQLDPCKYVLSPTPFGTTFFLFCFVKVAGVALVVESFRRRNHPHVWFLNGPIVLLYAIDRLACCWRYR